MTYRAHASEFDIATGKATAAGAEFIATKNDLTFIFNVNSDCILLRLVPEQQTQSVKELVNVMNEAGGGIENFSGANAFERLQKIAYTQGRDVTRSRIKTPANGDQPEKIQPVIVIGPVVA